MQATSLIKHFNKPHKKLKMIRKYCTKKIKVSGARLKKSFDSVMERANL